MFGMKAATRTLREAGEEIVDLGKENKKYLNEIQRLRAAFRVNMLRYAGSVPGIDAEIDKILNAMCKE